MNMNRLNRRGIHMVSSPAMALSLASAPPADGGGGGSPGMMPNNAGGGGGNPDPAPSAGGDSNNNGQGFDPASFWNGPAPAEGAAPSGESAGNNGEESGNRGQFAQELATRLEGLSFGEPIFDAGIAEQINAGDFSGVQERMTNMGKQIVREALAMQVQVLRPFAEQLMSQMRNETQNTFTQRDQDQSLVQLFPAAKNPVMEKTIRPIYDQALKNAKGDSAKAVAMTKEMLRFMAGEAAGDLNLDVAPMGEGGHGPRNPTINWLDELTSR